MTNFSKSFGSFRTSFQQGNLVESANYLSVCFELEAKTTLFKLYNARHLEKITFLRFLVSSVKIPDNYFVLISMIIDAQEGFDNNSKFFADYSRMMILQAVANVLEKKNTEYKYNEQWNVKYAGGNQKYLESERQASYVTTFGIAFGELLARFYSSAPDIRTAESQIDENAVDKLLRSLMVYIDLKDTLELHFFFGWSIMSDAGKSIKLLPPAHQREGGSLADLVNFQKLKWISEDFEDVAQHNLLKHYKNPNNQLENRFQRITEHISTVESDNERHWYSQAIALDIKADLWVEWELASFERKFFPGSDLKEIALSNGTVIPLRETFRILRFISELSKVHIEYIDANYRAGVNEYSSTNPASDKLKNIEVAALLNRNVEGILKETLSSNYDEAIYNEQRQIIDSAKLKVQNEDCLIKIELEKIVTTIHLLHNYPVGFIKTVISLFAYRDEGSKDVTRTPFFIMGSELCWMPNSVAFVSFGENLIENLLANKMVSIHLLQTDFFERNLNNVFLKHGYKVILEKENKKFRDSAGNELGDFDVLVYKGGALLYFQLKLTNVRNGYRDRRNWQDGALNKAKDQLEIGLQFINENPKHIRQILGLFENERIDKVVSFIASNSFLYDHENIGGFLKVSCTEIMHTLLLVEQRCTSSHNDVDVFIDCLNNNWLFRELEDIPIVHEEFTTDISDFRLIRSRVVMQNLYTSL